MDAIEWLLEIPKRNREREFLLDSITGRVLKFGEFHQSAQAVGADLLRRGLRKGDRVAILLNNSLSFAKLYLGCLYAGLVTVPINPILSHKETAFIIQHSGAKLLVVSPETIPQVDPAAISGMCIDMLAVLDGRKHNKLPDGITSWDLEALKTNKGFKPLNAISPDDTMAVVYTSGTTATPVGVVHSISDIVDNARLFNKTVGIGPQNRFYGILSMSYLGGYYNLLMLPYVGESSVVLANTFDARTALKFWQPCREWKVNTLWLVPTIMSILLEMDRGRDGESFCREQVRLGLVGTAPLPLQLRRDFEKRYGITVYENCGLSETLFISTNTPALPVKDSSVGKILPGIEISIRDEKQETLPCGREGEICVRTPYLMKGSYNQEKNCLTPYKKTDWFATGDVGVLSPEGDLFITGRKKDLIIRGGINISPASIEDVFYQHPAVAECAVVGIPHSLYGEDIAVALRLAQGYEFDKVKNELVKSCKDNLSAIKQPSHIFEIETFPRSSSGKIQKNKVRDLLLCKLYPNYAVIPSKAAVHTTKQKAAMLPGRVRRNFSRPHPEVLMALKKYPVSVISDCMNRMGIMDSKIRSLVPGRPFCGPAFTVEEAEAGNLMSHLALELIKPEDVLVIDAKGSTTRACWGGLQTRMAKEKGIAAIVINGCVRDYDDLLELGLPVYALGMSPGGPMKGWSGNINYPIACGGVVVNPGDVVMGDNDGVVVIPKGLAQLLPSYCEQRKTMEEEWVKKVKAGESTIEVVGLRNTIEEFGLIFEE